MTDKTYQDLTPELQKEACEWFAEVSDIPAPPSGPVSIRDVYVWEAIIADLHIRQENMEAHQAHKASHDKDDQELERLGWKPGADGFLEYNPDPTHPRTTQEWRDGDYWEPNEDEDYLIAKDNERNQ